MARRDHGDGGIDARGPDRWRLRWRVDGKRFTRSFHGSISDARKELRRLIKSADDGQHVAPTATRSPIICAAGSIRILGSAQKPGSATSNLPSDKSSRISGSSPCKSFGQSRSQAGTLSC
jgi:hypothetical protein